MTRTHAALRALTGIATLLALPSVVTAQAGTDIYLASVTVDGQTIRLGATVNATARPGYDNQPSFTPDGKSVLYTSVRDAQADIWRYDIQPGTNTAVTRTSPESEYSATVMPSGRTFSVIRVERDSTQRLWQFDLDGSNPQLIYQNVKPVGYHAWIDDNTTAMFVLGRPATLQIGNVATGDAELAASNIGRSLHKVPGQPAVSFLHRMSADEAWITTYDVTTTAMVHVVRPVGSGQDYVVMPDGTLVMGDGAKLFAWRSGWDAWREFADLTGHVTDITRLAVSPSGDRIAIVGADP